MLKMLFKIIWGIVQMSLCFASVLTDQLPALEAATTSKMVRKNLNEARKNFIEADSREKKNSESSKI